MRRGSVAVFNAQKIRLQGSNRRQEGPYHLSLATDMGLSVRRPTKPRKAGIR